MAARRHFARLLALFSLVAACSAGSEGAKTGARPRQLIVRFKSGAVGVATAAAAAGGSRLQAVSRDLNLYSVDVTGSTSPERQAKLLSASSNVLYAEVDPGVRAAVEPTFSSGTRLPGRRRLAAAASAAAAAAGAGAAGEAAAGAAGGAAAEAGEPGRRRSLLAARRQQTRANPFYPNDLYWGQQWAHRMMNMPSAWWKVKNSTSVKVCVIDSGVKWDHPDLVDNLVPMSASYQTANADSYGHGTHVAGIIGAAGNNGQGVAGVALRIKLLACRALNAQGTGTVAAVVRCMDRCRSMGARVINLSLVLNDVSTAMQDATRRAVDKGVFVSCAAGNGGRDNDESPTYPASYGFPGMVSVANVDEAGDLAQPIISGIRGSGGSNFGRYSVDLAAPGTSILSTFIRPSYRSDLYRIYNGTSMAAPYVSGAAALALAASGGALNNAQLQQLLIQTSTSFDALDGLVVSGGVIDAYKLVLAALDPAWKLRR